MLSAPICVQVWVLWVCATLLLMRGICGVLSDYQSTEYIYMCASGSLDGMHMKRPGRAHLPVC